MNPYYAHGQPIHAFANLTNATVKLSWFDDQGIAVVFNPGDRILIDNAMFTQGGSGGSGPGTYQALVLASSPLSYWRLNEKTGTVATDLGSLANNGAYTGTVGGSAGQYELNYICCPNMPPINNDPTSTAVTIFGGSAGAPAVVVPANAGYNVQTVTVEAMYKAQIVGTGGGLVAKTIGGTASTEYWTGLMTAGLLRGRIIFTTAGAQTITAGAITDLNWHHTALTYDGSNMRLYLDGVQTGIQPVTADTIVTGVGQTFLGNLDSATDTPIDGSIAETAIYGTALSGPTIAAHAAAMTATKNVILFYDNTGTGTVTAGNVIYEGSPTGAVSVVRGRQRADSGSFPTKTPAVYYTYGTTGSGASIVVAGRRLFT